MECRHAIKLFGAGLKERRPDERELEANDDLQLDRYLSRWEHNISRPIAPDIPADFQIVCVEKGYLVSKKDTRHDKVLMQFIRLPLVDIPIEKRDKPQVEMTIYHHWTIHPDSDLLVTAVVVTARKRR